MKTDVLIVGGGPAGAASAMFLIEKGFSTGVSCVDKPIVIIHVQSTSISRSYVTLIAPKHYG